MGFNMAYQTENQRHSSRFVAFFMRVMSPLWSIPIFALFLFLGALFWAKSQDPFSRKWFTLKTADHSSLTCVAVLPKPMRQYPIVIYAHGSDGILMNDGNDLRQMAELGLAAVSFEYDQTNEAAFKAQFEGVLDYLGQQKWADTNAIVWVGFSLGANRMLDFALQHPKRQPQLLIQLNGAGAEPLTFNPQPLTNLHCPVLLVHGEQDEVFPVADTKRLASALQTNSMSVELKIIPGLPHDLEPERGVVFRNIGEYCQSYLGGKNAWQNYHSIAQWQAEAIPLWLFWFPAVVLAAGWFACLLYRKAAVPEKNKLSRSEIALRWVAVLLAMWASVETAIHLLPPYFLVSDATLSIGRRFAVQPKERTDFEYLAAKRIFQGQKLRTLLDHVELANYNRELINWPLDDKIYHDFVLSPIIEPSAINHQRSTSLNWRRPLWEEFYPRIRHELSPEDAAKIVVRHLRERVTIARLPNPLHDVPDIWLNKITDEAGFEIIYVAVLRSVGVPARLNINNHAEFHDGSKWQIAPDPSVLSW